MRWFLVSIVFVAAISPATVARSDDARQQDPLEPALASLVDLINANDVEGLVSRVRFVAQPCSAESQTVDQPLPQCPAGTAAGTPVDTFLTASCGGFYVIGPSGARDAISAVQNQRVYDVLTGAGAAARRPKVRHIIVSADDPSKQGLLWYVTADGGLDGVLSTCSLSASESARFYVDSGLTSRLRRELPATGIGDQTPPVDEIPRLAPFTIAALLAGGALLLVCAQSVKRRNV
jgi:hypothetical protein